MNRTERMAEAVARETLRERRTRLLVNMDLAESHARWAPQAAMLLEALDELPPAGVCDSWVWADFRKLLEAEGPKGAV